MLLEIGIGDAYGAGFEFAPIKKIEMHNNLTSYHQHELGISPGNYTDDTQMSLAVAELMISGEDWTRENIANKFVECFKRDERLGYSKGFYKFLKSVRNGIEFLEKIDPKSSRNGAAMRSAPLGYVDDINNVLLMAELQASITHATEIGIKSSQAVAAAAHYFIHDLGSKSHVTQFVSEHTNFNWNDKWSESVACCGEETVNALLTILKNQNTLKDVLIDSVKFGGDVDTVAALGLGIASNSEQYESSLPSFLLSDLENGTYGREYLNKIGNKLKSTQFC